MNGLRKLILSFNHIMGINNNAFVGLESLEDLYLDHNYLSRVPSIPLQSLKRLKILSLGGNPLTVISTGDFVQSSVQEVFLDHCPLLVSVDRGSFWDLPGLREIHLHSNPRLEFVDSQAFLGVPSLQGIFLQNNSLLSLSEELVTTILHSSHSLPIISSHPSKESISGAFISSSPASLSSSGISTSASVFPAAASSSAGSGGSSNSSGLCSQIIWVQINAGALIYRRGGRCQTALVKRHSRRNH